MFPAPPGPIPIKQLVQNGPPQTLQKTPDKPQTDPQIYKKKLRLKEIINVSCAARATVH